MSFRCFAPRLMSTLNTVEEQNNFYHEIGDAVDTVSPSMLPYLQPTSAMTVDFNVYNYRGERVVYAEVRTGVWEVWRI